VALGSSPYLANEGRLGDVIAAIQAMGVYKFYKLEFKRWAERIAGDESQSDHWRAVFEQHPEFFRIDTARLKASLVLRRQRQKLYDVDKCKEISRAEASGLPQTERDRLSRLPLTSDEIDMLIKTAIDLHARALERRQDRRWWINLGVSFLGAVAGGAIAAIIAAMTKLNETVPINPPTAP
jgi:hypothetical protein